MLKKIKTYIAPFLNWRILVIYVPIWFLMSGWTYLFIYFGTRHHVGWMLAAGTFWATILWLPITPEKLITIPLTLYLYIRWRGHSDERLEAMVLEARGDWQRTCQWMRRNYYKIIKTLIRILVTILVVTIWLLILCG